MCQIDQIEGTESFVAIRRLLRKLFTINHGGSSDPSKSAGVKYEFLDFIHQVLMKSKNVLTSPVRSRRSISNIVYRIEIHCRWREWAG